MILRSGNAGRGATALAGALAGGSAFLVSGVYLLLRSDLSFNESFLFGDQSANLLVSDALHRGQTLYRDVAFPYGPLSIFLYSAVADLFANTPLTYNVLLAALAAVSVAMVAALVRRVASLSVTLAVVVIGLLPTMPLPGATVGGYLSSPYMPLERICLLSALLLWREPWARTSVRGVVMGSILGACQGIRFGSGAVILTAVVVVDIASSYRSQRSLPTAGAIVRNVLPLAGGFAAAEAFWVAWALLTIGGPYAVEFLWPMQLWETHQMSAEARWPTWGGPRMFLAQYLMPLVAAALGIGAFVTWLREPGTGLPERRREGALYVLFVFYALASIVYFRHEHHFRQFAWTLVPCAVPMLTRFPLASRAAMACVCLPGLWPLTSALIHGPEPSVTEVHLPRGYSVYVDAPTIERLDFLSRTTTDHTEPLLFLPHGSGWLYAYGHEYATRHAFFYSSAVVRPFEQASVIAAVRELRLIIDCTPSGAEVPLPGPVREVIATDFVEYERDAGCSSYVRRAKTSK